MLGIETALVHPRCRFRRHVHETYHVVAVLEGGFVEAGHKERRDVGAGGGDEPMLELLAQVRRRLEGRRRVRPPPWLLTARDLLADGDGPAALGALAARVGVHRVHLAREFRDHFGLTVGDYVRRRRLVRARLLVAETDLPLSTAAADAGFADQAHLTRAFRAAFGTTPGRYRLSHPLRAFKTAGARRP